MLENPMTHHHRFPVWAHRLLLNPTRRLTESPNALLGPHVTPGMTIFEPGCGLGWFTLPLARMIGPQGRVVAVEVEPTVLAGLRRRAERAGLLDRLDCRLADASDGLDGLDRTVDFVAAMHILHEIEDLERFLARLVTALKPGAKILAVEPRGPVDEAGFQASLDQARAAGLELVSREPGKLRALLAKPSRKS